MNRHSSLEGKLHLLGRLKIKGRIAVDGLMQCPVHIILRKRCVNNFRGKTFGLQHTEPPSARYGLPASTQETAMALFLPASAKGISISCFLKSLRTTLIFLAFISPAKILKQCFGGGCISMQQRATSQGSDIIFNIVDPAGLYRMHDKLGGT